jgi:hypothetical protein
MFQMILFRGNPTLKANPHQTFMGIWLHDDNLEDEEKHKMELYLNQTFYYYQIFSDMERFTSYISQKRRVAKIFFIVSLFDLSLYTLIDLFIAIPETKKVYIFLSLPTFTTIEALTITTYKTNNVDDLFAKLLEDIENSMNTTIRSPNVGNEIHTEAKPLNISRTQGILASSSKSISELHKNTPIRHFKKESITILSFLTMITILLDIPYTSEELSETWEACRSEYPSNSPELTKINSLANEYTPDEAIRNYSKSTFVFRIVNQACRTENVRWIYRFRAYIRDLHEQVKNLDIQQGTNGIKSSIKTVYRGKVLSGCLLQQLIDNERGLISMNGFLSTTLCSETSHIYAGIEQPIEEGHISVKFILTIHKVKQPYADISSCSAVPDDEEVLFSLGPIWLIESIEYKENFHEIRLASNNNLDPSLDKLRENSTKNECNLSSVGDILRKLGNYEDAEWFYQKRLTQNGLSDKIRGDIYNNLGTMQKEMGNVSSALKYFKEAALSLKLSLAKSTDTTPPREIYVTDTQSILISAYNSMGTLYHNSHDFDAARECYEQALEVKNGPKIEMAIVHDNLGYLYFCSGNYEQAREHHTAAVKLIDESHLTWEEFRRKLDRVD